MGTVVMTDSNNTVTVLLAGLHKRKTRHVIIVTLLLVFLLTQAFISTPSMQAGKLMPDNIHANIAGVVDSDLKENIDVSNGDGSVILDKHKNTAPLLTVPTRKNRAHNMIKKDVAKSAQKTNLKGWNDEISIDDSKEKAQDSGINPPAEKHQAHLPRRIKQQKKQNDSPIPNLVRSSLNTLKTIQTLSKLAGQGKTSSGGGMLDLMGSLVKQSGKENPAGAGTVIEPLLDTAIEWLGGDKNNGIKSIVKPI